MTEPRAENNLIDLLANGAKEFKITLSKVALSNFFSYLEILKKWNRVHNLTAITKDRAIVINHFLDSLSIAPFLQGKKILDLGSGAGFPGVPLALACPQKEFVLVESNEKKINFLNYLLTALKISNASANQSRAELFNPNFCFDTIITRAFGSLNDIIAKTKHLLCDNGMILVMKGTYPNAEIQAIRDLAQVSVERISVPYLKAERHLVILTGIKSE
jgi:16S rRNA (guanine527-N7)-methyltransferase